MDVLQVLKIQGRVGLFVMRPSCLGMPFFKVARAFLRRCQQEWYMSVKQGKNCHMKKS